VAYQPRVLAGSKADGVLAEINTASERFKTRLTVRDGRGTIDLTAAAPGN